MKFSVAKGLALASALMLLGGCGTYVKRVDFEAAMTELRTKDAALQSQADATKERVDEHRHE